MLRLALIVNAAGTHAKLDLDEWRKRYIDWVQLNKARLSDMFRRADRDADGRITREEFIESVLSSSAHY